MKPLVLSILAALLLFVPNAAAHTYLSETTPQDGANVTEALQQVTLKFEGKIEQGSTFKVVATDGTEFTPDTINLVDGLLTGTFNEALPNDAYIVQWNSISQDGHPLSGEFSFNVEAPITEEVIEEQTEIVQETKAVETTERVNDEAIEKPASPLVIVGGLLLGILFVGSIVFIMRKKD